MKRLQIRASDFRFIAKEDGTAALELSWGPFCLWFRVPGWLAPDLTEQFREIRDREGGEIEL